MENPTLTAFELGGVTPEIITAPSRREWMDSTVDSFANRCLPLLIANQAGWFILCQTDFSAEWSGGISESAIHIESETKDPRQLPVSHFGHGILTWNLPFLFRTSPGYNLLVRGPSNQIKDAIVPLEGVVETDWTEATFTMNWKFTRPSTRVFFQKDEPIAMIVPQRRGELESFKTCILPISADRELESKHRDWSQSRREFLRLLRSNQTGDKWQKHYMRGVSANGKREQEHQTKIELTSFRK